MSNNSGQSFFEVVVALGLISLVLVTLVSLGALSIKSSVFSRNQTEANRYTQQAYEWLVAEKNASWSTFTSHASTSTWCLDSLYWQKGTTCGSNDLISGTPYKRSVTFTTNADGSIQVNVQTSWTDAVGTHNAATSGVYTNELTLLVPTASPTPPTPTPSPSPVPGNSALCVSITAPDTVAAGATFPTSVTVTNNGTTTWKTAALDPVNYYGLTSWPWPATTFSAVWNTLPQSTVTTGQTVTFNFNETAPSTGGTYALGTRMLQQNVAWFGDICSKNITVTPPSWHNLGTWTFGCGTSVPFASVNASQFSFLMLSGGGGDSIISYNCFGSSGMKANMGSFGWQTAVNGPAWSCPWQPGQTMTTNVMSSFAPTSQVQGFLGCNDGETATVQVQYYGP